MALTGAGLVAYALAAPGLRDTEGFVSGRAMLPFAAGIAALAAAWSFGALRRAAWWGALFVVGQGAALQLIFAGNTLHYQHYLPWGELTTVGRLPVAMLVAQMVLVAIGLARLAPAIGGWLRAKLGTWRVLLLLALLVLSGATVSADVHVYARELVTASVVQLIAIGNLIVLVAAIPRATLVAFGEWADRSLGARSAEGVATSGGLDRFAAWCAVLATVACALLALFIYEGHPHVQDEVKYLFQARYLAHGMLAMAPPPVPDAFQMYLMDVGPRGWYSVVPPGWPAVLAIGVKLGVPWLVNPVLTGINILLAYLLLRRLYDLRTARIATLLLTLSPMHLFLGMSLMAHAITFTCVLVAALTVERARRTHAWWPTWLGGLLIGYSAIVRQLDGLIFAACLGLWAIGWGGKRIRWSATAGLVLGTALGAALVLPYNAYFTGHAATFPIMEYHDRLFGKNVNAYGFGPERGMGWALDPNPGHGPLDATINANLNTTAMNVELLGWAVGSLLLVYFLVLRGRPSRTDRAMLGVIAVTFIAYFFNYFSGGPDFGARYWFPMLLPLYALTARGLGELGDRLDAAGTPVASRLGHARALAGGAMLCLSATAAFIPWRMFDKYHHYLRMRSDIGEVAKAHGFGRSLVLVRGVEHPDYTSAATFNPLDLRADVPIYVRDRDAAERAALARAYPDRPVWIVDGPTLTSAGYRVVAGPLPAARLLDPQGLP